MKSYDSHHRRHHKHHSKHHHHHHHSHHHHSNDNINDNVEVKNLIDGEKENDTLTSLDAKKPEEKKERKKKIPLFFRILIIIVAVLFSLAIMGTCAVLIMNAVTRNKLLKSREDVVLQTIDGAVAYDDSGKTVEYKGQKYVYNENVITFAFFGIDDKGINTNVLPQLIVQMTLSLGSMILYEATLSYLNMGVKAPYAAWGTMINIISTNQDILQNYPNVWVPAGICIVIAVLGFNFVGDGLRDALDPKARR